MPSVRGPLPASEERDRGLIISERLGWGVVLDDAGRIAETDCCVFAGQGSNVPSVTNNKNVSPVVVEVVLPRLSGLSTAVANSQV